MLKNFGWVIYVCLLGIVGSAAIYAETSNGIAAGVLAGTMTLFVAIIIDLAADRVCAAVKEKSMQQEDIQIVQASAQAAYTAILELQKEKLKKD